MAASAIYLFRSIFSLANHSVGLNAFSHSTMLSKEFQDPDRVLTDLEDGSEKRVSEPPQTNKEERQIEFTLVSPFQPARVLRSLHRVHVPVSSSSVPSAPCSAQ